MTTNMTKTEREQLFENLLNGTTAPTAGQKWELYLAKAYNASRYYPTNAASKSGDIVANGIHYQIKSANGIWENINSYEDFENFILHSDKASRYLLKVGTTSAISKPEWLDVSKQDLLRLAVAGYVKFDRKAYGKNSAKWSMTSKEAMHLNMRMGIKPIKG